MFSDNETANFTTRISIAKVCVRRGVDYLYLWLEGAWRCLLSDKDKGSRLSNILTTIHELFLLTYKPISKDEKESLFRMYGIIDDIM